MTSQPSSLENAKNVTSSVNGLAASRELVRVEIRQASEVDDRSNISTQIYRKEDTSINKIAYYDVTVIGKFYGGLIFVWFFLIAFRTLIAGRLLHSLLQAIGGLIGSLFRIQPT